MKTFSSLAMFLALAGTVTTGCAVDPADAVDEVEDDELPDEEDDADLVLDAAGRYQLRSRFDLTTSLSGRTGDIVDAIIAATNDPDDPTAWILEQLIARMPSGVLRTLLTQAKPLVAGYLNDRLLEIAPGYVSLMVQLGNNFGQIATGFGLEETLDVSAAGAGYTSTISVTGARFKIDGIESAHSFRDHGMTSTTVQGIAVSLDRGRFGIANHAVQLSYGAMLRVGLDGAIIPILHPTARNLHELMRARVNCPLIGQIISSVIGSGGNTFTNACNAGLDASANFVYSKIALLDGAALELGLTGTARALDKNRDGLVDTIQTGAWDGDATYGGRRGALTGSTFYATRM